MVDGSWVLNGMRDWLELLRLRGVRKRARVGSLGEKRLGIAKRSLGRVYDDDDDGDDGIVVSVFCYLTVVIL